MTEAQLGELVRLWQRRLGLEHWEIHHRIGPVEDAYAQVDHQPNYERALITFAPWLLKQEMPPENVLQLPLTDRRREEVVVHELLHCWTRDYRAILEELIHDQVHRDVYSVLSDAVEMAEEKSIDRLASALVRSFAEADA